MLCFNKLTGEHYAKKYLKKIIVLWEYMFNLTKHTCPLFKASTTWPRASNDKLIAPDSFNLRHQNKLENISSI